MRVKIYSWNVNGIRAAQRKGFLDWLEQVSPEILCLQETKAWQEQLDKKLLEPNGYQTYWDEASKKGYSGTAIFSALETVSTKTGLPEKLKEKYHLIDGEDRDSFDEGRVVTAEYEDFYVVSVYTPNAKDTLERIELRHKGWDPAFLEYVNELEDKKPVIFCGDLNVAHKEIDLARPDANRGKKGFTDEEREGIDNILKSGFVDSFREFHKEGERYSWWSHWGNARANNVGWRIDYCFVSQKLKDKLVDADIDDQTMGSDHAPIYVELDF